MQKAESLIVIRRINKQSASHHGGAWKIAFADFALALMALFLVLWLIESTTNLEKQSISGYFSDPTSIGVSGDGGTPYLLNMKGRPLIITNEGLDLTLVRDNEDPLKESPEEYENPELSELAKIRELDGFYGINGMISLIQNEINNRREFEELKDSIKMELTPAGLKVQLIDKENRPMFSTGSARLMPYAVDLLWAMGKIFATFPNRLSVYGHTDSSNFGFSEDYTNWELSADRANAARRALVDSGVDVEQFAYVTGMASAQPYDVDNPESPSNRRIAILILNQLGEKRLSDRTTTAEEISIVDPRAIPEQRPLEIF